jgi:hypothetical protein
VSSCDSIGPVTISDHGIDRGEGTQGGIVLSPVPLDDVTYKAIQKEEKVAKEVMSYQTRLCVS